MEWDDLAPKQSKRHVLGEDIGKLSIDELRALIGSLQDEIARVEAAMKAKQVSKSDAEAAFKR